MYPVGRNAGKSSFRDMIRMTSSKSVQPQKIMAPEERRRLFPFRSRVYKHQPTRPSSRSFRPAVSGSVERKPSHHSQSHLFSRFLGVTPLPLNIKSTLFVDWIPPTRAKIGMIDNSYLPSWTYPRKQELCLGEVQNGHYLGRRSVLKEHKRWVCCLFVP